MIDRFLTALAGATARVPKHYFQLPVAGQREPLYRERVYSYELYHQLRVRLDDEGLVEHYALSGEIDKGGHPIIRHRCAPDLVFHIPGAARNLVVVEVKPINARSDGIRKDIENLSYFVSPKVGYELGALLVYGDARITRFQTKMRDAGLRQLRLYWHQHPGARAELIRL